MHRGALRLGSLIAAATLVTAGLVFVAPGVASAATNLGAPPDAGNYAHCNLGVSFANGASLSSASTWTFGMACQFGTATTPPASQQDYVFTTTWSAGSPTTTNNSCGTVALTFPQTGKMRCVHSTVTGTGSATTRNATTLLAAASGFQNGAGGGFNRQYVIDHVYYGTDQPAMPADYFTGGSAGDNLDAVAGVPTCDRTLKNSGGARTGSFVGTSTAGTNGTATGWSWSFGDGGAASPVQNSSHNYTASQPDNGWTATLTVTYTATAGHAYASGSTTATNTCATRVDFSNPDQKTPGGTDQTSPGANCPSGWGWLDPTSLVDTFSCLFVPTTPDTSTLTTSMASHFPFSVVADGIDGMNWLHDAIEPTGTDGNCPVINFGALNGIGASVGIGDPHGTATYFGEVVLPTPTSAGCDRRKMADADPSNHIGDLWGYRLVLRYVALGLMYLFFAWRVATSFGPSKSGLEPTEEE